MGYVNDAEQAKDLTQETFISVWKNLSAFSHESKIGTWIFRIATNNCLRAMELSKRVIKVELPYHLPAVSEETQDDKLPFLYKAIGELEEIERIIISLVLEDLPQSEIAKVIEEKCPDVDRYELFTGDKSIKNLALYERLGYEVFDLKTVNDSLKLIFLQKQNI
jgi:RNA polymerase sigma-70 factor (ECF subfamily)